MIDRNVDTIRKELLKRSKEGIKKYGTTTCRNDLSFEQWCQHAKEEALDQAIYLEQARFEYVQQIERKIGLILFLNDNAKSMSNKLYSELFIKIVNL